MPNPIGEATYKALGEPLFGDATVEQENSSNYIRTYVHTSANAGGFLMGMDFRADKASSLLTDLAQWDIDVDGGFRVLSGTTVLYELNSSGLYGPGAQQMLSTLGLARPIVSPTTGANYQVTSTQHNAIFNIGQNGTSQLLLLPVNPPAGFSISVLVPVSTVVDHIQINTSADSSAAIYLPGVSSAFSTADAIQPGSTLAHGIDLIALSSIVWFAKPWGQFAFAESTVVAAQAAYGWTTATTIA